MKHDADLVKGDGYGYLGHFAQRRYLVQGHNEVPASAQTFMSNIGTLGKEDDTRQMLKNDPVGSARALSNLRSSLAKINPGLGGSN